jgi:hypothetical protein
MGLISAIVRNLIEDNKILELSKIDLAVNTPENMRRYRALQKNPAPAYSGRYTTRSADELLYRDLSAKRFDHDFLVDWLESLKNVEDATKAKYVKRVVDDLVRRGVLRDHGDDSYSVIYE